ncbi:MAG: diaminopimelate decarboxylase [Angelakisella sp.]
MISDSFEVNKLGHLTIGGCDAVELAQQYGTPLYVMDEDGMRSVCKSYVQSMEHCYQGHGMVAYASKAMNCKALCRVVMEEGLGLDVVSAGELYTAIAVGFPASKIIFHGNNKTMEELTLALETGVGRIVVDNLTELRLLAQLAAARPGKTAVMLRIKPGIDAHTHDFVRTGQIDSKFGFALETGEAMEAVTLALAQPSLTLRGIHCHIGSQIFDLEPFAHAAAVMVDFLGAIQRQTGVALPELNLGGGFGIRYVTANDPSPYSSYMERVSAVVRDCCAKNNLALPYIILEPGRSIVGAAGATLYHVGAVKEIPNIRTYVSVDGGMTDNPRYALYHSDYTFTLANKAAQPQQAVVTVAGKCCESGDLLGENVPLQHAEPGDILAVLCTGAYNYSMSSNYNRNPRPPVVMVRSGASRVVVRRETLEDIVRNDMDN